MMDTKLRFRQLKTADYLQEYCFPEKFITYCEACDSYKGNYSCPPFSFNTMEFMQQYEYIDLIGCKVTLDKAVVEGLTESVDQFVYGKNLFKQVRNILDTKILKLEEAFPGSRGFFAGNCLTCPECARLRYEPCLNPAKVRYNLESFGCDMVRTASELLGWEIQWGSDYLMDYYVLVSALVSNEAIKDLPEIFTGI